MVAVFIVLLLLIVLVAGDVLWEFLTDIGDLFLWCLDDVKDGLYDFFNFTLVDWLDNILDWFDARKKDSPFGCGCGDKGKNTSESIDSKKD